MFLEHINLTVSDLNRSIDFYTSLLDLHVRWRRGADDPKGPAAHVGDERCYLAMFQATEASDPLEHDYEHVGLNHFGFVVDDLDLIRQRLEQRGITPHLEGDYDPGRRLYFHDPDGIEMELIEYEPAHRDAAPAASHAVL